MLGCVLRGTLETQKLLLGIVPNIWEMFSFIVLLRVRGEVGYQSDSCTLDIKLGAASSWLA